MSCPEQPIGEDDLEAFIDDRLAAPRRVAVEALLAADPVRKARVDRDRALRTELRDRLAGITVQPIPARLRVAAVAARRRARLRSRAVSAVAGILLLAAGAGLGWVARGRLPLRSGDMMREASDALSAHRVFVVEKVHPVEVPVAQEGHLVTWLSRRLGHTLKAPDLSGAGFQLMGGRLIPAEGKAAAQFMYEEPGGHRLTLFVEATESGDTAFRVMQSDGMTAFYWSDGGLGFALVGALDRSALLSLAETTFRQLEP